MDCRGSVLTLAPVFLSILSPRERERRKKERFLIKNVSKPLFSYKKGKIGDTLGGAICLVVVVVIVNVVVTDVVVITFVYFSSFKFFLSFSVKRDFSSMKERFSLSLNR